MSFFGDLVKKLRKERGMTLEQVARRIGSHKGYVSGIENGKVNPPSVKFIRKFAKLFTYDEKDMVRIATVDKAPALVRDEFRSTLLAAAGNGDGNAVTVPLLNTIDSGYATDTARPLTSISLRLPRFKVDVQYAATVCDASMQQALSKGDIVLLSPMKKLASGAMAYVIYRHKGTRRAAVRTIHVDANNRVVLQAASKEFPAETITQDDIDAVLRVVGRISVYDEAAVNSTP